jgi:hypothetical protein
MSRDMAARATNPADDGRTALYAAELSAFDGTDLEVPLGHAAAARLLAEVTARPWWPGPAVRIRAARGDAGSSSCSSIETGSTTPMVEVRLAAPQTTVATVAHELAHALAGPEHGHDGVFRRAYLDTVMVATNVDPTDRRGRLHVEQLADALSSADLALGERRWPPPPATFDGPIAL